GAAVTDAADALSLAAADSDGFGGAGLIRGRPDGQPGAFACADPIDPADPDAPCPTGRYTIAVASTQVGVRALAVTYAAGGVEFAVGGPADPAATTLLAEFGPRPLSPEDSALIVSPSNPVDDPNDPADAPDGVPEALVAGGVFEIAVSAWDAARDRPEIGSGARVELVLSGSACAAELVLDPAVAVGSGSLAVLAPFDPATGLATAHARSAGAAACSLAATIDDGSAAGPVQIAGSPKHLSWAAAAVDVSHPETWFTVSQTPIPADGDTPGQVTVSLRDSGGAPVTTAAPALAAFGEVGAGLSFGFFDHLGAGLYQASFTGAVPGSPLVSVRVDGVDLNVHAVEGNARARLTPIAAPSVGSEATSWASVTDAPGQAGVYGAEGAAAADWGRQTIVAAVLDADGAPLVAAGDKLTVTADPVLDPGGLWVASGAFQCQAALVDGACQAGVYTVDVYSGEPVGRAFLVTYADGGVEFQVTRQGSPTGAKALMAPFTSGLASAADSELAFDPGGPLGLGGSYIVTATIHDRFGNPVADQPVTFTLDDPAGTGAAINGPAVVYSSALGRAAVAVASPGAGTATVSAAVGGVALGAAAALEWLAPPPPPPPPPAELLLAPPQVRASNGRHVAGAVQAADADLAAAGSLQVVVTDDASGAELARCPVQPDGAFDCALANLDHQTQIWVAVEADPANQSPGVHVVVDALPPAPGGTAPSDGRTIAGLGEAPGHEVVVRHADGGELCRASVGFDASWGCDLAREAAEGETVMIEHSDAAGNRAAAPWRIGLPRVTVDSAAVAPGGRQIATGVNFQPGEAVTGVFRSDPVDLGSRTADADGRVTFEWTVPAAAEVGSHEV
ncbi:MAG: Ig-like domain-containing protein, partial [Bifidobacteriaceae bacterium]|nr:Ig-like domain-containing protein [Bifidobacteriaceae bacterium]